MNIKNISWIALDWGTSNLRAWAIDDFGKILAKRSTDQGLLSLEAKQFEDTLVSFIDDWLIKKETDIIACGMVGAKQGWIDAGYQLTPYNPLSKVHLTKAPTQNKKIKVHIISGVKQNEPADVMRGEETQIAGFLADHQNFSGSLCLPGTHTKWVTVSNGIVTQFKTFMTGELFHLLSHHSVLKHCIAKSGWDQKHFTQSFILGFTQPNRLTTFLFSLRAKNLIKGLNKENARSELSGLLMGMELNASQAFWKEKKIIIIGTSELTNNYKIALETQNCHCQNVDVEKITLAGLSNAYLQIKRETVK